MISPSLIDIIDTLSPAVTLGFGIYCAVNDTKPKDGKLSRAGKIALWGLIISGSITLVVKGNHLRVQLQEEEAKIKAQEKQRIQKAYDDSVNAAFEKATSDTLSKSVRELSKIKSASDTALRALSIVTDKQQAALENTRRGLNLLFPLKVRLSFTVDMNEFYKKYSASSYRKDLELYLDTLVYFATKGKIPNILYVARHNGKEPDTVNIPRATIVNPFTDRIPEHVKLRFSYSRHVFQSMFLFREFDLNLRKENSPGPGLTLHFKLNDLFDKILDSAMEVDEINTEVDMANQLIHVDILAENPEIKLNESPYDFISVYDLQRSIMGLNTNYGLDKTPSILQLHNIYLYTGYAFSRVTRIDFTSKDVKETCCREIYARKIAAGEIR